MKNYRQLVKELPSKTIVFAFGRFNPPTIGHELLFKVIQKVAKSHNADHVVYASRTQDKKKNPLSVERKIHYLKLMFKGINFVAANQDERTFIEAVKALNKKYKNLIMIAGSDRVAEYDRILNKYNGKDFHYDTIQVVSAGERDPDSDDAAGMSASKMRAVAAKGNYIEFKKGLPSSIRDIDGKLLMNELRIGLGLESIKEHVKFETNDLREKYFSGQIFHIGEVVESDGIQYEIMDRGSNYLTLIDESGNMCKKWIKDVEIVEEKKGLWANIHAKRARIKRGSGERMRKPGSEGAPTDQALRDSQVKEDVQPGYAPKEITYKGYTTKNLHHSEDATKAFQSTLQRAENGLVINDPVAILNAIKHTDEYMKLNDMHLEQGKAPDSAEVQQWIHSHDMAKKALEKIGEFPHHLSYWQAHKTELEFMSASKPTVEESLSNKTIKPTQDKLKVARVIADMLGVDKAESTSSPEQLINLGLRKLKSKQLNKDLLNVVSKMLDLADEVEIKYDSNLRPTKLKEGKDIVVDKNRTDNIADILRYSDFEKLSKMNKGQTNDPTNTHTKPGHSMHNPDSEDEQHRRRKVKYATEDLASADYKVNPDTGRKYRAHKINFANSKSGAKPDETPNEVEDENEYKKNLKVEAKKIAKVKPIPDDSEIMNSIGDRGHDPFFKESEELEDDDLDAMIKDVSDDDIINHCYDDDEFAIVDDETGEELKEEVEVLDEVLSRSERLRARARFARSSSKRERKAKIALKRYSSAPVINNRARRLAIKLMKKRLVRGRDLNKISVGEKERIEKVIQNRKKVINRLAMRLIPRIRQVEKSRLTHSKVTKGASNAVF